MPSPARRRTPRPQNIQGEYLTMKTFAAAIALVALLPAAPAFAQAETTQSAPAQPD